MSIEISPSLQEPTKTIKVWTPSSISTLTFFTSFAGGVLLASINWFRLGMRTKAFIHLFGGIMGVVGVLLLPDNFGRGLALALNIGFLAYIRQQMKDDISKATGYNIQNAHWLSGFAIILLGWGLVFVIAIGFIFIEPFIPGTAEYYFTNGNYYSEIGDYPTAITNYDRAIEIDPQNVDFYNNRGLAYRNAFKYGPALSDFNKAIELVPKYDRPYFNRATVHEDMEQINEAIVDFEKFLQLSTDPELRQYAQDELEKLRDNNRGATSYYNSAVVHSANGMFEDAIADLDRAIELEPNYIDAYITRGVAYGSMGEYDKAISDFDIAIEMSPTDAYAIYCRGYSYQMLGEFDRATHDYDRAIELAPNYVSAYNNRGVSYASMNDHQRAIADFNKAIALDPNDASIFRNRALSYKYLGQTDPAIKDFEHVLELSTDPELRNIAEKELELLK